MAPLLELRGVTKRFGTTLALDGVDFDLARGEVHALVGENGAGKSTALGLMYGVTTPDAGEVRLDGAPVTFASVADAQARGVSCVFQELSLAGKLSVAENIFAGRAPSRAGLIDWGELRRRAAALLTDFALDVDVDTPVDRLTVAERQVVEIAKALSLDTRVLLLDEPTSALLPQERNALFRLIRRLTAQGLGIVYVSHHLAEILTIADRVTVLRDGRRVLCSPVAATSESALVREMVAGGTGPAQSVRAREHGPVALALDAVSVPGRLADVSLTLRSGQILGLAGLLGSGAGAIGEMIAGLLRPASGTMTLAGVDYAPRSLREAMAKGVGFVPGERKTDGLFVTLSLADNVVAASLPRHSRGGIFRRGSAARAAGEAVATFAIRAAGTDAKVASLSGGNQQKVMIAKWLETRPRVLVVNEPTRGVDIGAKAQIHAALRAAADAGMAVVLISSDFPELLALSDRLLVVRRGRLAGVARAESEAELIALASGAPAPMAAEPQRTPA